MSGNGSTPVLSPPMRGKVVLSPAVRAGVWGLRRRGLSEGQIREELGRAGIRVSSGSVHRALLMPDPAAPVTPWDVPVSSGGPKVAQTPRAHPRAALTAALADAETLEERRRCRHELYALENPAFDALRARTSIVDALVSSGGAEALLLVDSPEAVAELAGWVTAAPGFDPEGDRARAVALLEAALTVARGETPAAKPAASTRARPKAGPKGSKASKWKGRAT